MEFADRARDRALESDPQLLHYRLAILAPCIKGCVTGKRSYCSNGRCGTPHYRLLRLWRLWAGILARQLLQAWACAKIPGVHGALPGWSVSDACMRIQLAIESAHETSAPIAGFTLDLIKAFNGLPRRPALRTLKKLGCPPALAVVVR